MQIFFSKSSFETCNVKKKNNYKKNIFNEALHSLCKFREYMYVCRMKWKVFIISKKTPSINLKKMKWIWTMSFSWKSMSKSYSKYLFYKDFMKDFNIMLRRSKHTSFFAIEIAFHACYFKNTYENILGVTSVESCSLITFLLFYISFWWG